MDKPPLAESRTYNERICVDKVTELSVAWLESIEFKQSGQCSGKIKENTRRRKNPLKKLKDADRSASPNQSLTGHYCILGRPS
jgi:hypothetical protein